MSLETSAIVALVFGLAIFCLILFTVLFVKLNPSNNLSNNKIFYLKKW